MVDLAEGRRADAVEVLRQARETARAPASGFMAPIQSAGALAAALEDAKERYAALAEAEKVIAAGCVGHNQLLFYPDAIEVALQLRDFAAAERYASLLGDFTRPEPLPWSGFFVARGRALAAWGRGQCCPELVDRLYHLRREGERLGYKLALPAIETVLAGTAVA